MIIKREHLYMFLFRLAVFFHPCLCRRVVLKCQRPALRGVLPPYIQRAARCTATLILVLPGEPFPRLCPDLGESLTAHGANQPYAGLMETQLSSHSRHQSAFRNLVSAIIDTHSLIGSYSSASIIIRINVSEWETERHAASIPGSMSYSGLRVSSGHVSGIFAGG